MEIPSLSIIILLSLTLAWAWRILKWAWLTPKKLERLLRQQGLNGNSYKFLIGDMNERSTMHREAESRPIGLLDDIVPRVEPLLHHSVHKHGKNSFVWFGTTPTIIVTNPDHIKDVFLKISDFQKPHYPAAKMLVDGLVHYEGEKWATQRKLMSSAFHMEKLKLLLPTLYSFCDEMVTRWEKSVSADGRLEIDAWSELEDLTRDMITEAAFGRCADGEGKRVFELQQELIQLVKAAVYTLSIPGWRFLPTKQNRRMNKVSQEVESLVSGIISRREKAMETSGEPANDLLGYLLESNMKVNKETKGNYNEYETFSNEDLILECKQFHLAGQLPTLVVLAWTMVLLSIHPEWQNRAREEVLQVFGTEKPDFDGLGKLKIVTMILYEVMRLYPPVPTPFRTVKKDTKLGKLTIPAGVQLVVPTILVHHDQELWGHDANEFNPRRFSEGLLKATNNQVSFFPFSWGPRMCIGHNLALLEAKMVIAMILPRFRFELSPTYAHAPMAAFLLQPQHGVQVVLHKV